MLTFSDATGIYFSLRMGGLQPSTTKAHRNELRRFGVWIDRELGTDALLTEVTADVVARYLNRLRPPVLAARSFNNYRQYLVTFFDHCRREGCITADPTRYERAEKVASRHRLQLRPAQVAAMMANVEPRDRFAIALGFNTALRAADLASLTVADVDLASGFLTVFVGKTQTEVRLPITSDLASEIGRWFAVYLAATGGDGSGKLPGHWLLVPSMHYQAVNLRRPELGTVVVYRPTHRLKHPERIVHRGMDPLNIPTLGEGFHTIRRSAARHMYEIALAERVPNPLRIVMTLLGHRNERTTEIYLGIKPDERTRDDLLRGRPFLTWKLDEGDGSSPSPAA